MVQDAQVEETNIKYKNTTYLLHFICHELTTDQPVVNQIVKSYSYRWSDLTETQDLEYFSEIMHTKYIS